MSILKGGCEITDLRKHCELLYEENAVLKEELDEVDGIIQGLRSKCALKDKKIQQQEKHEKELQCRHEKILARLKKKHDDEMTALQTKLHSAENEILMYQSVEDKANYYEGRIAILRGLNVAIMEKMKAVSIEKEALLLIISTTKIPDLTPEVCRLKAELKEAQILLSQMKLGTI